MPANVETMFYVGREKPWHGLGVSVEKAPTSAEALELAGLDWDVVQKEITVAETGEIIEGYKANVRSKDQSVLGVVTDRYKIVQNVDAFAFTDTLIGGDVHYETAGSLRKGKTIWLLAQLPGAKVAGDDVEQYLCFSNTHDGSGAVRVCITPVRVVCNNTLNLALSTAKRAWSIRHTGNVSERILEAKEALELTDIYMGELNEFANEMIKVRVDDEELKKALNQIFPITDKMKDVERRHAEQKREGYMICYAAPDIAKFQGTAWGAINAMADFATHAIPQRATANYAENNWGKTMNGHPYVDMMTEYFKR